MSSLFELFFPLKNIKQFRTQKQKPELWNWFLWTYPDKGPVTKVIDGAEEPELVQEKIGSCNSALVWKGQRKHRNI